MRTSLSSIGGNRSCAVVGLTRSWRDGRPASGLPRPSYPIGVRAVKARVAAQRCELLGYSMQDKEQVSRWPLQPDC